MFIGFFLIILAIVVLLPHVIRGVKWVYRNIVKVWADEVRKAWIE